MQWNLFLLILTGQCFFVMCQLYQYHFIAETRNWTDAQSYCRSHYIDLATVYDMTDMTDMQQLSGVDAWIGLYSDNSEKKWHWSLPWLEFHENNTHWKIEHPSDNSTKNCVRINKDLKLKAGDCSDPHKFICGKDQVKGEEKSWQEAQKKCREKSTDLISGFTELQGLKLGGNTNEFWIGLFRDTWKWSDGSSSEFRHETFNTSSGKCVSTKSGQWSSARCNDKKSFFCYEDKMTLIKEEKTWEEALDYCRENHHDLVSITNQTQQTWVQKKVWEAGTEFIWLGLRYTCTLDIWFWVNGEVLNLDNWKSTPSPTQSCNSAAAMETTGHKWVEKPDDKKFYFICV